MQAKLDSRPDLLLLLSLLLVILLNPMMDHSDWRRLALAALTFTPVILSTVRLCLIKSVGAAIGSVDVGQSYLSRGK